MINTQAEPLPGMAHSQAGRPTRFSGRSSYREKLSATTGSRGQRRVPAGGQQAQGAGGDEKGFSSARSRRRGTAPHAALGSRVRWVSPTPGEGGRGDV